MSKHWDAHPAVADTPKLRDKAADRMKGLFSTWSALFGILCLMGVWIMTGGFGSDPMPFILLNLCLSCLAALQCFILLIAAKRTDVIQSQLAMHDYQTNQEALNIIHEIHQAVADVSAKVDSQNRCEGCCRQR